MGLFSNIGHSLGQLIGWTSEPVHLPDRMPLDEEKAKAGMRIPAFLPFYDQQQNLLETAEMRLAYRYMLADPNVKAALFGKLFAVMSRELKIHPAVRTGEKHKRVAEFCEWNLKRRLSGGIPRLAWNILIGACIDGYSVNEKVWSVQDHGTWEGKRVLRQLKAKDPDQDLVLVIDEYRNITGVMGLRYNQGEVWHPREFLIYSHLGLYENPTGMSDLRAAYARFWILDTVLKLRAMGAEKRALPLVYGEYQTETQQTSLEKALAAIKLRNWLAVPKDTKLEVLDLAGTSSAYFESFRRDCQEEIFLSIQLATLQALTGGQGQMRGNSEVHQDTADSAKWVLAEAIVNCLNDSEGGLLRDMTDNNFLDVGDYPYATLKSMDDQALSSSITVDNGLKEMGYPLSLMDLQERYGRPMAEDDADKLPTAQPQPGGLGGGPEPGGGSEPLPGGPGSGPEPGGTDEDADLAELLDTGTGEEAGQFSEWASFASSQWVQERGKRGGVRWRNVKTGKITYEKPGPARVPAADKRPGERRGARPNAQAPLPQPKVQQQQPTDRAARAMAAHKPSDVDKQRYAERQEEHLAKQLGAHNTEDNLPMDNLVPRKGGGHHGIEIKTMVDNKNDKITMHPPSRKRKEAWAKKTGNPIHTVVFDRRKHYKGGVNADQYSGHPLYYARGVGAFRIGRMYKVKSFDELRQLLEMPEDELPPGARPRG